jgi:hypothetical protein
MTEREKLIEYRHAYLVWGDLDKPFHLPECECTECEDWRRARGRPTHEELRAMDQPKE